MRILFAILLFLLSAAPTSAQSYVAIAFHDVVDDERDLGPDAITSGQLTAFFDWLAGNGWAVISLDDIEAARTGQKPLPPNAILLTFDDGYASHYTRVYPLLRAYGFHAVFFLVGSWMEDRPDGTVRYGDKDVPRTRFLSWDQARDMAASGLAEFGSHSYNMHRGILGNPQGSSPPAAATWAYDPKTGRYETDGEQRTRVLADLRRSVELMRLRLGRAPRALAWSYGRSSGPALAAAGQAGFTYVMGLTGEPADTSRPMQIERVYPTQNPKLNSLVSGLSLDDPDPDQKRVVCLGLDAMADGDATSADRALGRTIEDLRRLGAKSVVLDPVANAKPGTPMQSVWFSSTLLPVKKDFLGFAAWQIRARAGVDIFLRLDLHAAEASVGREHVADLVREIVRAAPIDGVVLDPPGPFATAGLMATPPYAWSVRDARKSMAPADGGSDSRLALEAWKAAVEERPDLRLGISAPMPSPGQWPAPAADLIFLQPSEDSAAEAARTLAGRGFLAPTVSGRLVLPLREAQPSRMAEDMRKAQALGASAFALCPATLPASPAISGAFSISRFPRLP